MPSRHPPCLAPAPSPAFAARRRTASPPAPEGDPLRRGRLAGRLALIGLLAHPLALPLASAWAQTSRDGSVGQSGLAGRPEEAGQTPQAAQRHDWDLPAASLEASLRQVAHQAGLTLATDPALTAGRAAPPVTGHFTAEQVLQRLLAQSGLEAIVTVDTISIRRQPAPGAGAGTQPGATTLPVVSVTAQALDARTEGTGRYTQNAPVEAATGLGLTLRQTPQSMTVVTRQQLDDFNLTTLQDLGKVTPGVYFKNGGVSDQESQPHARGFAFSHINIDGQAMGTGNFNGRAIGVDLAIFDSVEVVRGATGLLQGAGEPSGTINLVRKRPTAEPLLNLSASLGSWRDKRLMIDASRALNASGTVRGRVVAAGRDSDSFVNITHDRNGTLYGVLEADLTEATTAGIGAYTQRTRTDGLFRGLPTDTTGRHFGLPRSTYLDLADTYQRRDTDVVFGHLEHRLTGGWLVKANWTATDGSSDSRYSHNTRIDGSETTLQSGETGWKYTTKQQAFDLRASGPVHWLGRTHQLVAGAHLRKDRVNWAGTWGGDGDGRIVDIYRWDPRAHRLTGAPPATPLQQQRESHEKGLYAAGSFQLLDPLKIVIGGRLSWFKEDGTGGWYTDTSSVRWRRSLHDSAVFVPYAGLIHDLDARHSVYASLTEIFSPQGVQDVNGNTLKPLTGTNYELGVKGAYFDGALNASAALFRISQRNRAVRDEANCPTSGVASCYRAAGEIESDGVELQLSGALTPSWQISAGYAYTSARYTRDSVAENVGQRVSTDEPRHLFLLASSYRLPGRYSRWTINGLLQGQSRVYTAEPGYYTEQGHYLLASLGAVYRVNSRLQLQLDFDNLFDRTYYSGLGASWSGSGERYGRPRSALLTVRYSL